MSARLLPEGAERASVGRTGARGVEADRPDRGEAPGGCMVGIVGSTNNTGEIASPQLFDSVLLSHIHIHKSRRNQGQFCGIQ